MKIFANYNEHHKNKDKLRNKILIEFDFKQKIVIGMSPRQVNPRIECKVKASAR